MVRLLGLLYDGEVYLLVILGTSFLIFFISSSDFEEAWLLLLLLEAVWMSRVFNVGFLLVEEIVDSFFTSSSNFWLTISKAILSLDLRLVCRVTNNLTKGFSKDGMGLTRFPNWGMALASILFSILSNYFPMTSKH